MNNDKMSKADTARKFLNRFEMKIVDSNRRYHRMPDMSYFMRNPKDDYLAQPMSYETEILHTIQIPESALEHLVDFYDRVEESMKYTGSMDVFNRFIEQKNQEKAFRESHPAVQRAYEQYQMLYKLAKSGND